MLKEIKKRSFEEVWNLAENNNFNQAVLIEVKTEIIPDEDQWQLLDYLKTEYHYTYNNKLIIDYSMRYTQKDIEEEGEKKVLAWIKEDKKRLKEFENGKVWMNGIKAVAKIAIPSKMDKSYKTTIIKSPGLWGIESDSSKSYIEEVKQQELKELENELKMLNVLIK